MSKSSNDQLYCKVCVLANERADYKDSPLKKKEVKEIFSNTRNLNFDIEHDHNYLSGVDIQETYINSSNEELAGETIPAGSWLMTLRVVNPDIRKSIEDGDLTGVSLETNFTDDVQVTDYENERLQYKDVITKEEMMPVTVSFTSKPANMLPMEVMTHQQYTAKHRRDDNLKEDQQEDEVTFLRGFVEKLFTNSENDTQSTAKSMEAVPQPQTNNFKYQELIDSMIETQKSLPLLTQTVNAISESQIKMTESFNELSQKIDTAVLTKATESLETGDTEEDVSSEETEQEEDIETTEQLESDSEYEESPAEQEPSEYDEQEEQEAETEQQEDTEEETDTENTDSEEDEEDPKKQKTAKNIKGANTRRPLTMDNSTTRNDQSSDYKQFMINRSYENLIENATKK